MHGVVGLRHQHVHVLAQHCSLRVSKNLLGRRVKGFDNPPLTDGNDTVHCGIQDGAGAGLALVEGLRRVGLLARAGEHGGDGREKRTVLSFKLVRPC